MVNERESHRNEESKVWYYLPWRHDRGRGAGVWPEVLAVVDAPSNRAEALESRRKHYVRQRQQTTSGKYSYHHNLIKASMIIFHLPREQERKYWDIYYSKDITFPSTTNAQTLSLEAHHPYVLQYLIDIEWNKGVLVL